MSSVKVTMDASSVIIAAEKMLQSINQTTAGIREAALESARYDSAGNLMSATMRGLDTEGRQFTATLGQLHGNLSVMSVKLDAVSKIANESKARFSELSKAVNEVAGMFQRFVGYKALNAMTDSLKDGFNAARKFQVEISLIRTISQDNQLSFGAWATNLKRVSDETGFGIADTTKAAYDAISNQVAKGNQTFTFLREAGNLARVNMGATLEQSVNLLSSSINAYGDNVNTAREKSALFFATIDEGRVTMKDMADVYGRVAILAKGLGVAETDLAASIAFLTQKGVTTDDAFTFLRNVFIQLQKPSEELSAFFRKIGVDSGEAAIKTYGYMGLLKKIRDEISAGNADVAKLFPEIRAQQPIQAALNDFKGLEDISTRFANTIELIAKFQQAIDIRAESPADYIDKEFNKIKNTFTVDIGQKLIGVVVDVVNGFKMMSKYFTGSDSISAGVNLLVVGIRDLVIVIVTFRTTTAITSGVMFAFAAASQTAGAAATRTAAQVTAANIAIRATVIGVVASLGALAASKFFFSNDLVQGPRLFESMTEEIKKMREEAIKTEIAKIPNPFAEWQQSTKKEFEQVLQGLAKFSTESDRYLTEVRESNKKTQDSFKNMFQGYTDSLKNNIKDLDKKVTEADETIKRARKGADNFRDSLNKMVDDVRLKYLAGAPKFQFLDQQFNALIGRAEAGYKSGDKDKIAEADKLIEEAARNRKERFDYAQELFKEQQQAYESANPAEQKLPDVAYKNKALTDSLALEKELNGLYALRQRYVADVITAKTKEMDITKKQIADEKLRLRNVEDDFKKFSEFSPFTAEGKIKGTYQDPTSGRVQMDKVKKDFDEYANKLRASVGATGNVQARLQVEDLIAKIRKEKILEVEALERSEAVKTAQQRTIAAQKQLDKSLADNKTAFVKSVNESKAELERGTDLGVDVKALAAKAIEYRTEVNVGGQRVANVRDDPTGEKFKQTELAIRRVNKAVDDYNRALHVAKTEYDVINDESVPKLQNIYTLNQASQELRNAQRSLYEPFAKGAGGSFENMVIPGTNITFGEFDKKLEEREKKLFSLQGDFGTLPAQRELLQGHFDRQVKPELERLKGLAPDSFKTLDAATQDAAKGLSETAQSVRDLKLAFENLTESFKKVGVPVAPVPKDNFTPPPTTPSAPTPRALGGWIGSGPTGRIGPDRHNIIAGDGEFMVNAESAAMFPDTLQAINAARRGSIPHVLGGNVSHQRIGDIYITVNEAKDGQDTSRQVWNRLRREMRRGNISNG